ncbi:hypothetical protein GDO81_016565 [Engystomops pustulosus]|uniref:Uncharacterized protein n=1 Tax=Engystomops pustulosus TaxID=76066 RepID=A0AAV7AYY1_ENGPU|nr:hypothetical protein GDO81_016565 [Engystomops pustulosus]
MEDENKPMAIILPNNGDRISAGTMLQCVVSLAGAGGHILPPTGANMTIPTNNQLLVTRRTMGGGGELYYETLP